MDATSLSVVTSSESELAPAAMATDDAAVYLSLSVPTLKRMRKEGTGPQFVKLGRSVRYRVVDLDAYLEEQLVIRSTS